VLRAVLPRCSSHHHKTGLRLPDISEVNGTAISNLAEVDGLTVSGGGSSFTGLLDTYTGADAAYSVRQLRTGETISMRIRRDTAGGTGDDDEADVAFDTSLSTPTISLNSAISNASSGVTATTFGEFVAASGYSNPDSLSGTILAYTDTWYDQSGNSINAEQATFGSQPQIYDGSAVITVNGKPAVKHGKLTVSTLTGVTNGTLLIVMGPQGSGIPILVNKGGLPYVFRAISGNTGSAHRASNASTSFINGTTYNALTMAQCYTATSASQSVCMVIMQTSLWSNVDINIDNYSSQQFQEVIFWDSDQDSAGNTSAIQAAINSYYTIY